MTEQATLQRMGPLQIWIACRADGLPILETTAWSSEGCAAFATTLRSGEQLTVKPFTLTPPGGSQS